MSENIDYKIIKGRYVFPGNLKIPVKTIERLPKEQAQQIFASLSHLYNEIKVANKTKTNVVVSVPLKQNVLLYADYTNKKLNLYLETDKEFTQILNAQGVRDIDWHESIIIRDVINKDLHKERNKTNTLVSSLVRSAYIDKINNRGSPTVFGKTLNDDFTLDL